MSAEPRAYLLLEDGRRFDGTALGASRAVVDAGWLDEDLAAFYESEARWAQIVQWATLFALAVAVLGLFGLASLTVAQRTKEIGVRKALGATAAQIVGLLSKEFAVIVGVAFLVAAPAAYVGAQRWLQDFAYHIELGPLIFALAGGLTLAIALATVSIQTLRAARIDPAQTLRSE